MNKLVIFDGNAIIHRAYHAIPPLSNKDGKMVNAVYGFASMLLRVWKDLKPDHIVVTFDVAGGTFRHAKFDKYKATRVKADQELYDQIPLVHDLVRTFNIPVYEKKGYEADDVIGTIVNNIKNQKSEIKNKEIEIYIVTGDMDTLQLIQPGVKVYTLRKGISDVVIYDADGVRERFGFGPEMIVDYKALRGDPSDNIPGVPGVGEKTATDLIKQFGGIEEMYKRIKNAEYRMQDEVKPGVLKKLIEGEESAKMSRELATIDRNVPDLEFNLADCELKNFDREKTIQLFQELGFVSLLKRIPGVDFEDEAVQPVTTKRKKADELNFIEVKHKDNTLEQIYNLIQSKKQFSAKAIMSGADIFSDKLLGMALVIDTRGFWVPAEFMTDLWKIFTDDQLELVGHDLKKLVKILHLQNVEVKNKLFDVMIASYLLNPGTRAHDVASVILTVLGKELKVGGNQTNLFGVDGQTVVEELYLVSQTVDKLRADLVKIDDKGLFEKVEMPLVKVLADMELHGVAVDEELLNKLSKEAIEAIKKVSAKIFDLAGQEFNISSPLQLREILFEKLEIPVEGIKKGKTGLSTGAEQLEKMRGLHPIIDLIENYRELTKLQNTYTDVLPTLVNKKTHRIHTTFNQAVTATGRLSSSEPNLQNIPIRTEMGREIRKAFIAEEGNVLVVADYSQIELRIVASLAEDKKMMEIFEADEDIHKATAAAINGVTLKDVTKEMRRAAKEINFGVLYGMGVYGLSWRAEIPQWEAKAFIEKYFSEFSGVKKFMDSTLELAKKTGYCETLFGRRRYIPDLHAANFQLRAAAERMAINHPVQGTAADLMKMAMVKVWEEIKKFDEGDVRLTIQVHDELVLEVKKHLADKVSKMVKEVMEGVVKLRVPVKVEIADGKRWGGIK